MADVIQKLLKDILTITHSKLPYFHLYQNEQEIPALFEKVHTALKYYLEREIELLIEQINYKKQNGTSKTEIEQLQAMLQSVEKKLKHLLKQEKKKRKKTQTANVALNADIETEEEKRLVTLLNYVERFNKNSKNAGQLKNKTQNAINNDFTEETLTSNLNIQLETTPKNSAYYKLLVNAHELVKETSQLKRDYEKQRTTPNAKQEAIAKTEKPLAYTNPEDKNATHPKKHVHTTHQLTKELELIELIELFNTIKHLSHLYKLLPLIEKYRKYSKSWSGSLGLFASGCMSTNTSCMSTTKELYLKINRNLELIKNYANKSSTFRAATFNYGALPEYFGLNELNYTATTDNEYYTEYYDELKRDYPDYTADDVLFLLKWNLSGDSELYEFKTTTDRKQEKNTFNSIEKTNKIFKYPKWREFVHLCLTNSRETETGSNYAKINNFLDKMTYEDWEREKRVWSKVENIALLFIDIVKQTYYQSVVDIKNSNENTSTHNMHKIDHLEQKLFNKIILLNIPTITNKNVNELLPYITAKKEFVEHIDTIAKKWHMLDKQCNPADFEPWTKFAAFFEKSVTEQLQYFAQNPHDTYIYQNILRHLQIMLQLQQPRDDKEKFNMLIETGIVNSKSAAGQAWTLENVVILFMDMVERFLPENKINDTAQFCTMLHQLYKLETAVFQPCCRIICEFNYNYARELDHEATHSTSNSSYEINAQDAKVTIEQLAQATWKNYVAKRSIYINTKFKKELLDNVVKTAEQFNARLHRKENMNLNNESQTNASGNDYQISTLRN
ncbi:MAG: hypothetical protein Tsb005_04080 [Gammaproteobacteria bacterium]